MVDGPMTGIACGEARCLQHDAVTHRCRLVAPIATHDIKFVFALERCPISLELAAALVRCKKAPKDADAARAAALDAYEADLAPPGHRIIDRVVDALAARSGDDPSAPTTAAEREAIDQSVNKLEMTGPPRRRISPVNAAAVMVVAALLALYGWSKWSGGDPTLTEGISRLIRLEPDRDLGDADHVALELQIRGRAFVSVYALPDGGAPVRLFPPLGTPVGIPWPIEDDGGTTWRIPGPEAELALPRQAGRLVALASRHRAPDLVSAFRGRAPTNEELTDRWPMARIWTYGSAR